MCWGVDPWTKRIRAIRAIASTKSHTELDETSELDEGNPQELGSQYLDLTGSLESFSGLGGVVEPIIDMLQKSVRHLSIGRDGNPSSLLSGGIEGMDLSIAGTRKGIPLGSIPTGDARRYRPIIKVIRITYGVVQSSGTSAFMVNRKQILFSRASSFVISHIF